MWSSHTRTHRQHHPLAFFILTLSHASVIIITTAHICMHMRAFSRTRMECVCVFYNVYTPFNFCLHSLMAWLRPIPEFFNGFFSRLCAYRSPSCSCASASFRGLVAGEYVVGFFVVYFGLFFFVLKCLWVFFFTWYFTVLCFFECDDDGNDCSFLHKIDNLNGIF